MKHYDYLIIGGGMTADAAIGGIRELDSRGTIGLVSAEPDPPYDRPPLSKGLWKGKPLERIWRGTAAQGVDLWLDCRVERILPRSREVVTQDGERLSYHKLLLATGGRPKRLPWGNGHIIYLRTLRDYQKLRALAAEQDHFAVIGAGFIGSEIAAALAMQGKRVSLILRGATVAGSHLPIELGEHLNELYASRGVALYPEMNVTGVEEGRVFLHGVSESIAREIKADAVVAGIGLEPNDELARDAGLYVDDGIWVDEHLRTGAPDTYAAGDVASFHHPLFGRRRVEHEDNANSMGRVAGRNMAGANEQYLYLPYFYSDLFDVGYEAVGEIKSDNEMVVRWKRPLQEGSIYYLKRGRVRGVVYWNSFGRVDEGRRLIIADRPVAYRDLPA